ncbi:MAG: TIGR03663 family protein, partial [Candidatus Methanoperedens sp.]|nr:TIGR03663 family protein [Candidatus Methanoperedens sp.]
ISRLRSKVPTITSAATNWPRVIWPIDKSHPPIPIMPAWQTASQITILTYWRQVRILYYSRFYREDIFIAFFSLMMLVCAVMYMEKRNEERYSSIKVFYLFLAAILLTSVVGVQVVSTLASHKQGGLIIATTLLLLFTSILFILFSFKYANKTIHHRYSYLRIFYLFLGAVALASMAALKENAYIAIVLIILFLFLIFIREKWYKRLRKLDNNLLITASEVALFVAVFLIVFSVFYTSSLFDFYGMKAAFVKAVSHWYEMHAIQRMGGPWFFYLPIIALYELPVLIFGALGMAHYSGYFNRKIEKILIVIILYWVAVDIMYIISNMRPELSRFLPITYIASSIAIFFPLVILGIIAVLKSQNLFFSFLTYWTLTNLAIYSYIQEKVPWLILNPLLPLALIAAAYIGEILPKLKFNSRVGTAVIIFLVLSSSYSVYSGIFLNYYDFTNPAEPLIQAAQPPQKFSLLLGKINEISSQYQNHSTEIQLTDVEMETQFLWYMRHFTNVKWKVSIDSVLDAPLIVVHDSDDKHEPDIVKQRLPTDYERLDSAKMSWYWFKPSDVTLGYLLNRKMDRPPSEYRIVLFYKPRY